jgi:hypothetical protein
MWFRVFGTNDAQPQPAALLEHLAAEGLEVTGQFRGDDLGWFRAELACGPDSLPLERYLVSEEGIRAELNNWAAWIETCEGNPHQGRLMQHMISTTQLFTLRQPLQPADRALVEKVCVAVCQHLARETAGVYQADARGIFAADGALLLRE